MPALAAHDSRVFHHMHTPSAPPQDHLTRPTLLILLSCGLSHCLADGLLLKILTQADQISQHFAYGMVL